ncbi:MAG: ABC transporter ATP-binding protein [bacterium]|nr:ABC transporter ATP-binding protein [bacterium]
MMDQLRVENVTLHFRTSRGPVQAVDQASFTLPRGLTLAVIGESGCGKTSLARAILRLLPRNIQTYKGSVYLNGTDVMKLDDDRFRREVRWVRMALVPQAAMNALNPVVRVGDQVAESLVIHRRAASKAEAMERAAKAFALVGVPTDFLTRYAFELSGGMRQRVAIAMALVIKPDLVVLDEPTSALDVLTQANLMNVLKTIKQDSQTSFMLITHDIATSSELADRVAVMYAGHLVEIADARQFYPNPVHPYSKKLMASVPTLRQEKKLEFIPGQPPSLIRPPGGCRFKDRCPSRFERCEDEPKLAETGDRRQVRCWLHV